MFRKPAFVTIAASCYLLLYCILLQSSVPSLFNAILFFFSPFVLVWLVLTVLKDQSKKIKDLQGEEEWGYQDRSRNELGMF